MTIFELGALGEFIGSIAVVLTIGYLAFQIKQNTAAMKASSHHAITDSFNNINIAMSQDPQVARRFRMGSADLSSLDEDELGSYSFQSLAYQRIFETLYYQRKIGTMEEQLFVAEEKTLRWVVSLPGWREWWRSNPISLSEEYRAYIDRLIEEETSR